MSVLCVVYIRNLYYFCVGVRAKEHALCASVILRGGKVMMAWHIVERIIAWESLKKRHQIRHKRAMDLSRNNKEKTASKKQE